MWWQKAKLTAAKCNSLSFEHSGSLVFYDSPTLEGRNKYLIFLGKLLYLCLKKPFVSKLLL